MKIMIVDTFPTAGLKRLQEMGHAVVFRPDLHDEALVEGLRRTLPEILVVRSTRVEARHLDASPALALVIRAGAGVNTIDVAGASTRGISVANCPGTNAIAVAELAFAHLLALDRRLVDGVLDLRQGLWNKQAYEKARGIYGRTLGILGMGRVGREMASRAFAFGMTVVAWSRSLTTDVAAALGVQYAARPLEVARRCDVLSVHVALTPETHHLVDASLLAALPDGAFVINTSRSGVVDEAALLQEVRHRHLRAALDVFEGEPAASTGFIEPGLFAESSIQGSHHIGASTEQAQRAVVEETLRIVEAFVRAGNVLHCVNRVERSAATGRLG